MGATVFTMVSTVVSQLEGQGLIPRSGCFRRGGTLATPTVQRHAGLLKWLFYIVCRYKCLCSFICIYQPCDVLMTCLLCTLPLLDVRINKLDKKKKINHDYLFIEKGFLKKTNLKLFLVPPFKTEIFGDFLCHT